MRTLFFCLLLSCTALVHAQQTSLAGLQPDKEYDNVFSKQIYSDSLATTFVIWIKHKVPLHKHAWHTEQVVILEGEGEMILGDTTFIVRAGDHITIPQNTPHAVNVTSAVPLKVLSIQAPYFDGTDRVKLE